MCNTCKTQPAQPFNGNPKGAHSALYPHQAPVQHINSASPHMVEHGLDLEAASTLGQRCKMVVESISTVELKFLATSL